jgi:hypothetical protein
VKRTLWLIPAMLFLPACRGHAAPAEAASSTGAAAPAVFSQSGALAGFKPALPAVLDGGVCRTAALPARGVRELTIRFPDSTATRTTIFLTLDSAGKPLSYTELRGNRLRAAIASRADALKSDLTTLHLNYVSGTAMAMNHRATGDSVYMGSVADLQADTAVGDLHARVDLVRRICGDSLR